MITDLEILREINAALFSVCLDLNNLVIDKEEKEIQEILQQTYHKGFKMDKKIAKIQKENKKEGKDLSSLKKMDKKQDKKIEMMKKKKK